MGPNPNTRAGWGNPWDSWLNKKGRRRVEHWYSLLPLLPDCGAVWPDASGSYDHAFPTMMDCAIKLWAKEFLSFLSCFCQMVSCSNERQLHSFHCLLQKPSSLGKLPVSCDDLLFLSFCLYHYFPFACTWVFHFSSVDDTWRGIRC